MTGLVFNEVAELYDRVRPGYPDRLFDDLVAITGLRPGSPVLESGCGTGQATRSLVGRGLAVTAVEPGAQLAAVARRKAAATVVNSTFEEWDDQGVRFDAVVAASSWHWVDPAIGWRRAYEVLRPGGWIALLDNIVVARAGEPEVYAETADLHERFAPGNPAWGHPPREDDVEVATLDAPAGLFGPAVIRSYPTVQWFDGAGFADHLRSLSLYRTLPAEIREPLAAAVADRIRTRLGDRAARRYLTTLRLARRADGGADLRTSA